MANFGWDYPPGVTGNELAISGPDSEVEATMVCPNCTDGEAGYRGHDVEREGFLYEHAYSHQRWFVCGTCDSTTDIDWPDPD
jgi:hypothetical protein